MSYARAAVCAALLSLPAAAEESKPLPKWMQQHATRIDDPHKWPSSSIGKVFARRGNFANSCTASLVGKQLVLTAAHCLFVRGSLADPKQVFFVVGIDKGTWDAHSGVTSWEIGPDYGTANTPTQNARSDWAILRLSDPMTAKPIPVAAPTAEQIAKISADKSAFQIGFGAERMFLPSIARDCEISAQETQGVFTHKCLFNYGYSGSPILASLDGEIKIIGVESGYVRGTDAAKVGFACSASGFAATLAAATSSAAKP